MKNNSVNHVYNSLNHAQDYTAVRSVADSKYEYSEYSANIPNIRNIRQIMKKPNFLGISNVIHLQISNMKFTDQLQQHQKEQPCQHILLSVKTASLNWLFCLIFIFPLSN